VPAVVAQIVTAAHRDL